VSRGIARRIPATGTPLLALIVAFAAAAEPGAAQVQEGIPVPDVPFVETPLAVVEQMLELAEVSPGDTVIDLGSGDGRIPVMAAARFGAPAIGVEIQEDLVAESRARARRAGVDSLVQIVRGDLFETDLRRASVVTLYLLWSMNIRLRPKLLEQLRPGARVVSHQFRMGEWQPDSTIQLENFPTNIYLWVIPAEFAGTWRLRLREGEDEDEDEEELTVRLEQRFQELRGTAVQGDRTFTVRTGRVRGTRVRLTLGPPGGEEGNPIHLEGTIEGDRIEGEAGDGRPWSAVRVMPSEGPIDAWSWDDPPDSLPDPPSPGCCGADTVLDVRRVGSVLMKGRHTGPLSQHMRTWGQVPAPTSRPHPGAGRRTFRVGFPTV